MSRDVIVKWLLTVFALRMPCDFAMALLWRHPLENECGDMVPERCAALRAAIER